MKHQAKQKAKKTAKKTAVDDIGPCPECGSSDVWDDGVMFNHEWENYCMCCGHQWDSPRRKVNAIQQTD